ncbi:hypothetical protein [Methylobacterium pseudosasicola]|uniref:Uncharacterized protein n=1 Tax=Methylobacterium pseudosasicola TaxID=582667 RepID=A0A1I4SA95_9HYPH|nr:hypothetical protein [Methylobacterium pseudosasicola]SFM61418.1 hypothetical protein SAMN05192568_104115 [Methylobacterium pseudosasicola]
MHGRLPTVADLRRSGRISSHEIVAAIDMYMRDPAAEPYRFTSGHSLDIAALVASSISPAEVANRAGPQEKTFRNAVAAVVMAAHPTAP